MSDTRMIPADEADNTTPVYTEWQMEAVRSMFHSYQSIIDDTVRHAGLEHMVQDDGDGDWGAIWELIWEKLDDHQRQAAQIERVREVLHRIERADEQAQHDWDTKADMLAQGAAMGYSMSAQWLEEALGDTDD